MNINNVNIRILITYEEMSVIPSGSQKAVPCRSGLFSIALFSGGAERITIR